MRPSPNLNFFLGSLKPEGTPQIPYSTIGFLNSLCPALRLEPTEVLRWHGHASMEYVCLRQQTGLPWPAAPKESKQEGPDQLKETNQEPYLTLGLWQFHVYFSLALVGTCCTVSSATNCPL